jgi:hypothetical protein
MNRKKLENQLDIGILLQLCFNWLNDIAKRSYWFKSINDFSYRDHLSVGFYKSFFLFLATVECFLW